MGDEELSLIPSKPEEVKVVQDSEVTTEENGGKPKKQKKKSNQPAEGEVFEDWSEETYWKSFEYFRDECKLPGDGMLATSIPTTIVSDAKLLETFGPKKGQNGYSLTTCTEISVPDIIHLTQILDGYEKPGSNGRLTKFLAKGIIADFLMGHRVNWAAFAHDKLKVQLRLRKQDGATKPTGPPWIRIHRVYSPAPYLCRSEDLAVAVVPIDPADAVPGLPSPKIESATCSSEARVGNVIIQSPSFPFIGQPLEVHTVQILKEAIAVSKRTCEELTQQNHDLNVSVSTLRSRRESLQQKVTEIRGQCEKEHAENNRLIQALEHANEEKRGVDMEIDGTEENDDSDEDDAEVGLALESKVAALEMRAGEINIEILKLETEVKASSQAALDLGLKKNEASDEILSVERELGDLDAQVTSKDTALLEAKSMLEAQKVEFKLLTSHFERNRIILVPKSIATSVELKSKAFWMTTCPVCSLGFHCQNFMPTSCGHSYHPACMIPLLGSADEDPKCIACNSLIHPDWLEAWGVPNHSPRVLELAQDLGLHTQQRAHQDLLKELYTVQASSLALRRQQEREHQQQRTIKFTKEDVQQDVLQLAATNKARFAAKNHSGCKSLGTEVSGLSGAGATQATQASVECSDESEDDDGKKEKPTAFTILLQPKIEGETVKGKGQKKRKSSESETIGRKASTRGATRMELATSDCSPSDGHQVVVKPLNTVKSPQPSKSPRKWKSPKQGKGEAGSGKSTGKSSSKANTSRRKLPLG